MSNEHADLLNRLRKYEWGFRTPNAGEDWQWPAQCPLDAADALEILLPALKQARAALGAFCDEGAPEIVAAYNRAADAVSKVERGGPFPATAEGKEP